MPTQQNKSEPAIVSATPGNTPAWKANRSTLPLWFCLKVTRFANLLELICTSVSGRKRSYQWRIQGRGPGGQPPLILCPFQTFSMPVFNILLKISRHVVQNVARHLSYLARPVIRDHVQLGISSKGQTVTHCCEKQRMYESKFQGKNYLLWLPRNKSDPVFVYFLQFYWNRVFEHCVITLNFLYHLQTEAMKPYVSVLGIPRFVLICCALLFSWAKGNKTTRRFVGLPESGQRVSHNDTSGSNRTLIIRHNLPVSQVVHRSDIYPQ